jgi:hypothetical protein
MVVNAVKRKSGFKPKGDVITSSINMKKRGNLSSGQLAYLARKERMERAKLELERRKKEEALARLSSQLVGVSKALGVEIEELPPVQITPPEPVVEPKPESPSTPIVTPPNDPEDADDTKSAYQMLQDMRWVYRNVSGRKKLKDMMGDDKQFQFLVKELMKIETALMSAKVKAQATQEGNANGFFVIIKGLEDDKAAIARLAGERKLAGQSTIDLNQIEHALNPENMDKYVDPDQEGEKDKEVEIEGPERW